MEGACNDGLPRPVEWDKVRLPEKTSTTIAAVHIGPLSSVITPADESGPPDNAVGFSFSYVGDASGRLLITYYSDEAGENAVGSQTVWTYKEVAEAVKLSEGSCRKCHKDTFKDLPRTSQFTAWQKGTEELETYRTKRLATLALGREAVDATYRSKNPVKLSFSNGTVLLLYLPVAYRETVTIESLEEMTVDKRVYTTGKIPPTWCVPVTATLDNTEALSMPAE